VRKIPKEPTGSIDSPVALGAAVLGKIRVQVEPIGIHMCEWKEKLNEEAQIPDFCASAIGGSACACLWHRPELDARKEKGYDC
jgi:hypothetical protein